MKNQLDVFGAIVKSVILSTALATSFGLSSRVHGYYAARKQPSKFLTEERRAAEAYKNGDLTEAARNDRIVVSKCGNRDKIVKLQKYFELAFLYLKLGDLKKTEDYIDKLYTEEPKFTKTKRVLSNVIELLAIVRLRQGRIEKAKRLYLQALEGKTREKSFPERLEQRIKNQLTNLNDVQEQEFADDCLTEHLWALGVEGRSECLL